MMAGVHKIPLHSQAVAAVNQEVLEFENRTLRIEIKEICDHASRLYGLLKAGEHVDIYLGTEDTAEHITVARRDGEIGAAGLHSFKPGDRVKTRRDTDATVIACFYPWIWVKAEDGPPMTVDVETLRPATSSQPFADVGLSVGGAD